MARKKTCLRIEGSKARLCARWWLCFGRKCLWLLAADFRRKSGRFLGREVLACAGPGGAGHPTEKKLARIGGRPRKLWHIWNMSKAAAGVVALGVVVAVAACAHAQTQFFTDPLSGAEFSRIGALNNPAYGGQDPFNIGVTGRGSVGYEYSIGRFEVTTAQWVEFYNAAFARPDPLPIPAGTVFLPPVSWGAITDPGYAGPGTRWIVNPNVAGAGMRGVPVSWRTAAIYCNWLHNGKSTDAAAFMSGAYDVSTFSASDFPTFTDQASRSPGARYWIPSWDEWLKAVHYDPLKPNLDGSLGGWWQGPLGSDALPLYGPPAGFPNGSAANQANSDWSGPNFPGRLVPLGSYPNAQTPWGLLDAAGGTGEWTESIYTVQSRMSRISEGSEWDDDASGDEIFLLGGTFRPNTSSTDIGLRIATSIPQPGVLATTIPCFWYALRRSRRSAENTKEHRHGQSSFGRRGGCVR